MKAAAFVTGVLLFTLAGFTLAQDGRSYFYESIVYDLRVNPDSTVEVAETQTFNFNGAYHAATREIPLRGLSYIDGIEIIDGQTRQPLRYTSKRLDKLDPASWGQYTFYREGGQQHIEWYYDLADTTHAWTIRYKVHGAIAFYDDHDELYWNLFTDYSVPIGRVEATINLPSNHFLAGDLEITPYTSSVPARARVIDNQTFIFEAANIPPQEKLTFAVGWPKGLINQAAFWRDFIFTNWGYLLSLLIAVGAFLAGYIFWYKNEKHNFGRGTIVPQYEPPQNLKPAMAEVIVKEKITDRAWPATIVDLAVRGFIKIEEDQPRWGQRSFWIMGIVFHLVVAIGFLVWLKNSANLILNSPISIVLGIFAFLIFGLPLVQIIRGVQSAPRDYILHNLRGGDDSSLEDYEKKFLKHLFMGRDYFSTKEFRRRSNTAKTEFASKLKELRRDLYKEVQLDTKAFDVTPDQEIRKTIIFSLLFFLGLFSLVFLSGIFADRFQFFFITWTAVVATIALWTFIYYEARLSKEGQILKEDWLGFKQYLATAEKYRLQNLTPDLFEKFLPYAIIFGVERKWGRAFGSLEMASPNWYAGSGPHTPATSSLAGFSASAFSASFASSFTSAFASSGGGASGGGGGAGGGGGGGGGGAS